MKQAVSTLVIISEKPVSKPEKISSQTKFYIYIYLLQFIVVSISNHHFLWKNVFSAKSQAFNFNNRSTSSSRFGSDFPTLQDKSSSFNSNLYGSSSATNATGRFPIGTFSLDTNNMYNSSGDSLSNSVFSNGNNSNSSYSDSNSANLGTRETGIIEKLLVRMIVYI